MKILKVSLLLFTIFLNSCKPSEKVIENATITYQPDENTTSINSTLVLNPIKIDGNWGKISYNNEYNRKKKNYFLFLKHDENILGVFLKFNSVAKNRLSDKRYFINTLVKEFKLLDKASLDYLKTNTDEKSYQTYVYKDYYGITFHGLIGIRNEVVYHLNLQNNKLNDTRKEEYLINIFKTMKP